MGQLDELTDGVIILRRPRHGDAIAVAAAAIASLEELRPWMPWAVPGYDVKDAMRWVDLVHAGSEDGFVVLGAPGSEHSGVALGTAGLSAFDTSNQRANLGYWIRSKATGRGFATRATRLLARHGHDVRELHRIEIMMSVDNVASRRVAERSGAHHEGILRGRLLLAGRHHDAHIFSLLPGDLD